MTPAPELTVILPVFNEAKCLERKLEGLLAFAKQNPSYYFHFVDDGSTDNTAEVIRKGIEGVGNVSILPQGDQHGKGAAIRVGFQAGGGEYFCFLDGDLPYSLDHLHVVRRELEKCDVVIGCRNLVPHVTRSTLRRRILGWVFNRLARMILCMPYTDTQAGLKGFRRKVGEAFFPKQRIVDFSFDVELLFIARKHGFNVCEIPATVSDDHSYKIGKIKLLKDSLRMFGDLISIRVNDFLGRY